jgi:hypothetical protein
VCCEFDLLVPPFRGAVVAGDQPHPVQATKVAVDERIAATESIPIRMFETGSRRAFSEGL